MTSKKRIVNAEVEGYIRDRMRKDTRLTFRIQSELKRKIESIAQTEGQSVGRICEAFLLAGSEEYEKKGPKFLVRYIGRTRGSSLP